MTKTCKNCEHRTGDSMYPKCELTGNYISCELEFGGRCVPKPNAYPERTLWEPRRTFWMRLLGTTPDKEST